MSNIYIGESQVDVLKEVVRDFDIQILDQDNEIQEKTTELAKVQNELMLARSNKHQLEIRRSTVQDVIDDAERF